MSRPKRDISGQKFNALTAVRPAGKDGEHQLWEFNCDCGRVYTARGSSVWSGSTQSCGCFRWRGPRARFLEKTQPEPNSGCLLWLGPTKDNGYGVCSFGFYKNGYAHRFAWEMARGPIPGGLFVLHRCDTRCCVNVDHLFLGTHAENMADMVAKGRGVRGERVKNAKLTRAAVEDIRSRYVAGVTSQVELARQYGVVPTTIGKIIRGERWT